MLWGCGVSGDQVLPGLCRLPFLAYYRFALAALVVALLPLSYLGEIGCREAVFSAVATRRRLQQNGTRAVFA